MVTAIDLLGLVMQTGGGLVPRGTRAEVFAQIYWVFLILGTLVGVIVIGYMVLKAYRYRADGQPDEDEDEEDRPQLGEIPTGGGGGKKLFTSFTLSTIVVVSLIAWTYGTLLYVEQDVHNEFAEDGEAGDPLVIEVEGYQFAWDFVYPNGHTETNELRIPADREIQLRVTSRDVMHNFGIPELRVKTDAIPGEYTDSWFVASEPGEYRAVCYELCGSGHSQMRATVTVMEPGAYEEWYGNTSAPEENGTETPTETEGEGDNHGKVTA
jgi:cytochrome c oxidase subunit 2